jgi:hypothetical protein
MPWYDVQVGMEYVLVGAATLGKKEVVAVASQRRAHHGRSQPLRQVHHRSSNIWGDCGHRRDVFRRNDQDVAARYRVQVHESGNPVISMDEARRRPSGHDVAEHTSFVALFDACRNTSERGRIPRLFRVGPLNILPGYRTE